MEIRLTDPKEEFNPLDFLDALGRQVAARYRANIFVGLYVAHKDDGGYTSAYIGESEHHARTLLGTKLGGILGDIKTVSELVQFHYFTVPGDADPAQLMYQEAGVTLPMGQMNLGVREDLVGRVSSSIRTLSPRFGINDLVIRPFEPQWRRWAKPEDRVYAEISQDGPSR